MPQVPDYSQIFNGNKDLPPQRVLAGRIWHQIRRHLKNAGQSGKIRAK